MADNSNPYASLSSEVKTALDELSHDESVYAAKREAEELFVLRDAVQIFFVAADGRVSTFSQPSSLRVFQFKRPQDGEEWAPVFIQVDGWTHPLIPGASPVLEAANGALMFPDVYADEPGSAVGIVVDQDAVDQEVRDELRRLLEKHTALKTDTPLPLDRQLGKTGRRLVKGAEYLCKGMDYGTQKAIQLIEYAGEREKQKSAAATEDAKVGAGWRYTAKGARHATHATVKVSGFVANRVGRLTKGLANYLASKAERPITGAVTTATGGSTSKSSSMHNIVDAARGGLVAFGTIYAGLEDSAKVLGTSVKNNSVGVVEHKYGEGAGEVFGDAATAAGNAALTYMHVSSLGVKGLVKKTAKDTGKAVGKKVLEAHVQKNDNDPSAKN